MDTLYRITAALLLVILISLVGCKSKQDAPSTALPQDKSAAPGAVLPQGKTAAPVVPPQDKADAQAAAVHVLALLEAGDFPAIYRDSAVGFKEIGSESQFVAKFQQTRKNVGVLRNPQQISFGTLPGNAYVFVYRVENERYKTDMRLTFTRSASGKMELAGLNQHDTLKR